MKTLKQTYKEIYKLRNYAEHNIKADIIKLCEKNNWEFNSYTFVFTSIADKEEIAKDHPEVKKIAKIVDEFETHISQFDCQWGYHPTEWKNWITQIVNEIKLIKKTYKV